MKTIPQIRDALLAIAATDAVSPEAARKIKRLVTQMKRRKALRRASVEHVKATPSVLSAIRASARSNPGMSYALLGRLHHVSIGRVSEALVGKRAA